MSSTSPTRCDVLAISGMAAAATLLPGRFAPAEGATTRPFNISVPEEALVDLRLRLATTCWPDKETVSDRAQPPESWVWRAYRNLIYFHEVDRGGHFAGWKQPELFAAELRVAFQPLAVQNCLGVGTRCPPFRTEDGSHLNERKGGQHTRDIARADQPP